jgi:hypothetical protein
VNRRALPLMVCACAVAASCAPKIAPLPSGAGAPFPGGGAAYAEATARCRGVRTLSAELGLSGRVAGNKVRGRILAGFAAPADLRLEAPAPFGRPVFVLVARGDQATLVLNRDRRVLRDAPTEQIVDALAGVPLGADALRATVAGCGFGGDTVSGAQLYPGDWAGVETGDTRSWLRRVDATWRVVASTRGPLEARYDDFASGRPATVRLRNLTSKGAATDLVLRLSQVDINVALDAAAFEAAVPDDALPMTLDELRRNGPLGAGEQPQPDSAAGRRVPSPR